MTKFLRKFSIGYLTFNAIFWNDSPFICVSRFFFFSDDAGIFVNFLDLSGVVFEHFPSFWADNNSTSFEWCSLWCFLNRLIDKKTSPQIAHLATVCIRSMCKSRLYLLAYNLLQYLQSQQNFWTGSSVESGTFSVSILIFILQSTIKNLIDRLIDWLSFKRVMCAYLTGLNQTE